MFLCNPFWIECVGTANQEYNNIHILQQEREGGGGADEVNCMK